MWENGSVREVYLRDNDRLAVDLGEERRGVADGGHTPEVIVELGGRLTRQRKLGGEILAQLERAAATLDEPGPQSRGEGPQPAEPAAEPLARQRGCTKARPRLSGPMICGLVDAACTVGVVSVGYEVL